MCGYIFLLVEGGLFFWGGGCGVKTMLSLPFRLVPLLKIRVVDYYDQLAKVSKLLTN